MRIEKTYEFTVDSQDAKKRLDVFLASKIDGLSRSALTGSECEFFINNNVAKKSDSVRENDKVCLFFAQDVFDKVEPQNIELDVIYEDQDMLVINKPQGLVVHPGAGNVDNTVVNALAYRYGQNFIDIMADECDVSRPGIVHRLDKDTSGVMIIALNAKSHANLCAQFQNREIKKYYYALCEGFFTQKEGFIEKNLSRDKNDRKLFTTVEYGGKVAKTHYHVERQFEDCALVKIRIYTGRTHQIRVHLKSIGHPVCGDVLYNPRNKKNNALMLHSYSIQIKHPLSGKEMVFTAPLGKRFEEYCI